MATISQQFVEVDELTVRRSVIAAMIVAAVVAGIGTGLAGAQSGETCVDIATANTDGEQRPTTVLLESTDGDDYGVVKRTTEASDLAACPVSEDLDYAIHYEAPPGEYLVQVRYDEPRVNERWGNFDVTVEDVDEESFWFERVAPYHTEISFDSPRDSDRFEPGETAQFSARVYNGEESGSKDVTTEVYVYREGEARPEEPTKTVSAVSVQAGQHADIEGSVPMPETEGEYVVDVEFKTDFGFRALTSDYVDLGTVTVDAFERPRIDDSTPSDGAVNVGPDDQETFSVSVSDPDSTPTVRWYVDGSRVGEGERFEFDAAQFGAGAHTVRAVASDETDVTADADIQWTVDVADAPEITGVSPSGTVVLGEPVTFSVDTESTGHQYRWAVGGRAFSGNGVEKTFSSPGERATTVSVTNDRGVTATRSFVLPVERAPPSIPDLSVSPSSVTVGESVEFLASATDPADRETGFDYEWTVDGRTFSGSSVETSFSEADSYDVTLTVTNDYGSTTTRTRTVTVEAAPPEVTDTSVSPSSVTLGERVTLSASARDPAGRATGFDYEWTVGDRTFEGDSVETTFSEAGSYDVALTVTNDYGEATTSRRTVTVEAAPPEITELSVSSSSLTLGERLTLSASARDPADRATGFDYEWTIGDRTFEGSSVDTTFSQAGTYDVNLTVTNDYGEATTSTRTISVATAPPEIAELSVSPASLTAGERVSLSATATDPAERETGFTYRWTVDGESFSGATAETRLSAVGTHDVELQVTNEYGTTTTRSQSVTVSNDEPTLERRSPTSRPTPRAGTEQRFLVRVADADAEPATVTWSVDGKQVSSQSVTADERRLAVTHRFTDPGTHTVEATVEDGHGARTSLDWTVAVQNRPPRIEEVAPASATFSRMSGTTQTFNATATDPDGGPVRYRWLVDGSQQSTGPRYTHAFNEIGTHNVTVVATDSDGGVATHSWSAAVRNFRRVPEIESSATVTTLEPGNETRFIALSFRNPDVNDRTANVELALSLPSGVTVSATRNIQVGSQPEYVGEATVTPGQQTSISLAVTARDGVAGQQIEVPYQVIYYPAGQRDSYRVVENATTTIRIVGDETPTRVTANESGNETAGTTDGNKTGRVTTGNGDPGTSDDPEPASGSGPGFTVGTLLLALPLWLLARRL